MLFLDGIILILFIGIFHFVSLPIIAIAHYSMYIAFVALILLILWYIVFFHILTGISLSGAWIGLGSQTILLRQFKKERYIVRAERA